MDAFYALHIPYNRYLTILEYGAAYKYHLRMLSHYFLIEIFKVIFK